MRYAAWLPPLTLALGRVAQEWISQCLAGGTYNVDIIMLLAVVPHHAALDVVDRFPGQGLMEK